MTDPLDCNICGACCLVGDDELDYVFVSEDDFDRLPRRVQTQMNPFGTEFATNVGFIQTRRLPSIPSDMRACVAWTGTPGVMSRCTVYDKRPAACSRFRPGSDPCLNARKQVGMVSV